MQNNSWIRFEETVKDPRLGKALERYEKNSDIGLDKANITVFDGKELIVYQSGGNFPKLSFLNTSMKNVSCEVIAAYNALVSAGKDVDFFKLAFEFELNAALYTKGIPIIAGCFGSDPFKIGYCLEAYDASYEMFRSCDEADNALKSGRSGIISYRWPLLGHVLHLPIHTFSAVYDGSAVMTFNRFGSHTGPVSYSSVGHTLAAAHDRFMVGYVIY